MPENEMPDDEIRQIVEFIKTLNSPDKS